MFIYDSEGVVVVKKKNVASPFFFPSFKRHGDCVVKVRQRGWKWSGRCGLVVIVVDDTRTQLGWSQPGISLSSRKRSLKKRRRRRKKTTGTRPQACTPLEGEREQKGK